VVSTPDVAPTLIELARLDPEAFRRKVAERIRAHRPRIADALANGNAVAIDWVVGLADRGELDELTTAHVRALGAAVGVGS
jgi:hypothetical protein